MPKDHKSYNRGFVILFAVILVSIVLTISLSIFNITFKQLVLSSVARESQYAFFAADSAMNCAKHFIGTLDNHDNPFGYYACDDKGNNCAFTDGPVSLSSPGFACFSPGGNDVTVTNVDDATSGHRIVDFVVKFTQNTTKAYCAKVHLDIDHTNPGALTKYLLVQGFNNYNQASANCPTVNNDRTVERAQDINY